MTRQFPFRLPRNSHPCVNLLRSLLLLGNPFPALVICRRRDLQLFLPLLLGDPFPALLICRRRDPQPFLPLLLGDPLLT
jgi:hypothetical protein